MKKLFFPLLILGCISATTSCKKEIAVNHNPLNSISTKSFDNEIVADSTRFGALICTGTTADKIVVMNKLNVKYARVSVILTEFTGRNDVIEKCVAAGIKVIANLNYQSVQTVDGVKVPNPFPTDMVAYRAALTAVLDKYASQIEVAVIENEPTTASFHSGPIEDYITMLGVAINVCHSKGVKVADGSTNVQYVQRIMNGSRLFGTAIKVQKLITAYTTLPLDFVNVHTQGTGSSYPDGLLQSVANYLRTTTRHPVMSNEWHLESDDTSLVKSMVKGWKEGGYVYSLIYGGGGKSDATAINSGTDLLPNGITYKNSIQ